MAPGRCEMRCEVRALEMAVSSLVCKLDMLITDFWGLDILGIGNGIHVSTPEHLSGAMDAFVTIRPVDWPKVSYITAHFYHSSSGWKIQEGGEILADHLAIPGGGLLRFKSLDDGIGVVLDPFGELQTTFVAQARKRLAESLS